MGIHRGPNLVKDDLVFGYDTGYGVADNNTATRFYPGESTDNKLRLFTSNTLSNPSNIYRCTVTEQNIVDVTAPNGQYSRYTGIDGSSNNQVFYSYAGSGFNYTGQTITYSVSLKGSGTCHLTTYDDASGYGTSGTITLTNKWVRYSYTRSVSSSASSHWSGVRGIISSTDVYVAASQMEIKGHSTPFTPTTRSSTQSLIDLKSTTDIDVSNVSFDSNGQPDFDGTDDEIQIASSDWNKVTQVTVEAIVLVKGTPIDGNGYHVVAQKDGAYSGGSVYGIRISGANVPYGVFSKDSTQAGTHIDTVAGTTMTTNKYYHLVYTRKVGQSVFYQNGEQKSINTSSNDVIYNNTSTFTIGQGDGRQLYGNIPVLKVHNNVLSADEIKQNYNAYKNRFNI